MQAALYRRTGPAEAVFSIEQLAMPTPGPGEVRIRVAYSGVNPSDVKARGGVSVATLAYDYVVPHSDGSGVVDALGEGVTDLQPGARVWFFLAQWRRQHGSAAEYVCLPAWQVVPLPEQAGLASGAALGIPLLSAWYAVYGYGSIAGMNVLVTGGAGAVSFYAIQLARMAGANVIATVSSKEKAALALQAGANHALEYGDSEALAARLRELTGGAGADVIIEVNAAHNAPHYGNLLAQGGRVVVYGSQQSEIPVSYREMMGVFGSLSFFIVYLLPPEVLRHAAREMNALLAAGDLLHLPAHIFPLQEIAAAHRHVESGSFGKALLSISPDL